MEQHLFAMSLITEGTTYKFVVLQQSLDCRDSTCLGHLGRCNTDRFISMGQGKYIPHDIPGVMVPNIALNFANVNSA